jgi:hypothetical protein
MSMQADKSGYQCSPRERLDALEDYESLEVKIDGPHGTVVDPHTMDLPAEVAAKFPRLVIGGGPSIGANLTWSDVDAVVHAIRMASRYPNNGVPRGVIGWAGRSVYHGTSGEHADDIIVTGIDTARSNGYYGTAFYAADDEALAIANYAEMSGDDDGGAVLEVTIEEGARIFDMRNAEDSIELEKSGLMRHLGSIDLDRRARALGIDGLYDRSVGGVAIYNAKRLSEPVMSRRARASVPKNTPRGP